MPQPGFFDLDNRYETLSKLGDPLDVLKRAIPWESFRSVLEQSQAKFRKSNAGRKPYDCVLMFKVLILQSLYNLSDDQTEYQIRDRLSFMRFLDLPVECHVPDAKTLWLFRDHLVQQGLIQKLFKKFNRYLDREGYAARKGQIVDASIVPVPTSHNTRTENVQIRQGDVPKEWAPQPHKRRQKDTDARWTRKHGKNYYGYKNHISIDRQHKVIRNYTVTDASVHESQVVDQLLDVTNTGKRIWGDSAYRSKTIERLLKDRGFKSRIHRQSNWKNKLSEAEQRANHRLSKIRIKVEHVFGFHEKSLGGKFIRTIGILRAKGKIGMMNMAYNMRRYVHLEKLNLSGAT